MYKESVTNLKKALEIHNQIEKIYIKSMNYSKINKITDKLISAIFKNTLYNFNSEILN